MKTGITIYTFETLKYKNKVPKISIMNQKRLDNIFNNFFNKQKSKTSHETLANYNDNTLIAGGKNGLFYTHICYHTIYKALLDLIKQK